MKKKVAKQLRQLAVEITKDEPNEATRKRYKQLKNVHKTLKQDEKIK